METLTFQGTSVVTAKITAKSNKTSTATARMAAQFNKGSFKKRDDTKSVFNSLNQQLFSGKVINDLFALKQEKNKSMEEEVEKRNLSLEKKNNEILSEIQKPADPVQDVIDFISSFRLFGTYQSQGKKAVFLSKKKQVLL
ncbi:MAG: hypothetical protein U9N77_16615, partial [Thermodesulfobacteriota bacterium]|nr:hypothetical protein [Thermodesulfobacteriota bacterium]